MGLSRVTWHGSSNWWPTLSSPGRLGFTGGLSAKVEDRSIVVTVTNEGEPIPGALPLTSASDSSPMPPSV
jgi:hypothetical protein